VQSGAIRCNRLQSGAIGCNRVQSGAIRCNQVAGRCGCSFTRYEEYTTVGDFVKSGCVAMP